MALTYTRITGETVLLWAALHNREATFRSLLQREADISIQDKNEDTILHHLATKANPYLVTLLQHPHDIDLRNKKSEIPLLCAVQAENEKIVDQLLQADADPSASTTIESEGETRRQLELEIHENNRMRLQRRGRVGEIYIRRGYNVEKYGERFKRPLHFAAQKEHRNFIEHMLSSPPPSLLSKFSGATTSWQSNAEPKNHKKRLRRMRRKKGLLCAWSFEGILQEIPFMNAFISIQRLTHGLKHHKRQR